MRAVVVVLVVLLAAVSGCATSSPSSVASTPTTTAPAAGRLGALRQLAVVPSGESRFTVIENSAEPGRTFDEVLRWGPFHSLLRPIAELVHEGINWLLQVDRKSDAAVDLGAAAPRSLVSAAFVKSLDTSGRFGEILAYGREPRGEDRRRADAIVRITVPTWGLIRVQEGDPDLLSAFADVRAEMVEPATGVVVWADSEDVTHPERLPLKSFTSDREFTRQQLLDVLDRAGQRLASELLYSRGAER
jgi:hypothetical protein